MARGHAEVGSGICSGCSTGISEATDLSTGRLRCQLIARGHSGEYMLGRCSQFLRVERYLLCKCFLHSGNFHWVERYETPFMRDSTKLSPICKRIENK